VLLTATANDGVRAILFWIVGAVEEDGRAAVAMHSIKTLDKVERRRDTSNKYDSISRD